jgi:uncharacterized membrane protein
MRLDLRNNKDLLAGLLLLVIGGIAIVVARDYPFGSAMRMGPGYFPTVLGGILCVFGAYLLVRGIRVAGKTAIDWNLRPVALLTAAIVLFGLVMSRLGLVPALVAMTFVAALAGREFRVKEVALLAVALSAFAVVIFVYVLRLPFPLVAGLLWMR